MSRSAASTAGAFVRSPSIGVRLQSMPFWEQALVLARLASSHSEDGSFNSDQLRRLFLSSALPVPANVSDTIAQLRNKGFATRGRADGSSILTPVGREASIDAISDLDLSALCAEGKVGGSVLGRAPHAVVPATLAPASLIPGLRRFLAEYPFERNVFGMCRFPHELDSAKEPDPVGSAIEIARRCCELHGLVFHLASDRAIDDDLWTNVAAHMWACQYGIAFFEDRQGLGLNYNLTIEVGSMLMTGRRCALLKDLSSPRLPTDLVGRIYKSANFDDTKAVAAALHEWIRDDLGLGTCPECNV